MEKSAGQVLTRNWHRYSSTAGPVPVCYDYALARVMSLFSKLTLARVALAGFRNSGSRRSRGLRLGLGRCSGSWLGLGGPSARTGSWGGGCNRSIGFAHNINLVFMDAGQNRQPAHSYAKAMPPDHSRDTSSVSLVTSVKSSPARDTRSVG